MRASARAHATPTRVSLRTRIVRSDPLRCLESSRGAPVSVGPGRGLGVTQLLVPVGPAALGGEVEQVPDRLNSAHVTWVLPGIGRRVEELRTPEVADPLALAAGQ